MERILNIELFGEHFKFKADAEDKNAEDAVKYLVSMVQSACEDMPGTSNDMNKFSQLLLATLNICNEHMDLKEKYRSMLHDINKRSSKIVSQIDSGLK